MGARGRGRRRRSTRATRTRSSLPGMPLDPAIRATSDLAELDELRCLAGGHAGAAYARGARRARRGCDRPLVLCSKGIEEAQRRAAARGRARGLPDVADRGPVRARPSRMKSPPACRPRSPSPAEDAALGEALRDAHRAADLPHLSHRRRRRRGDRRRGQERARDRLRRGRGQGPRPERPRRADRARLRRNDPLRPGAAARGARRSPGLSGLGDLVLTCSSTSSRNFSLGKGIGEGRSAAELMADRRTVAEGAFTAPVLARLAREQGHRHADRRGGRRAARRASATSTRCSERCCRARRGRGD